MKGSAEIAWALENEEEYNFTPLEPAMDMVTPSKADGMLTYQEKMTQKQYEIKYQQDLKTYTEKVETHNNNRERVAGLLWNRCKVVNSTVALGRTRWLLSRSCKKHSYNTINDSKAICW